MFHKSNVVIQNLHSTTLINENNHSAFYTLANHVCVSAYQNKDGRYNTRCHPGTRLAILKALKEIDGSPSITWLSGPMGAGKTAIACSLVDACQDTSQLAACFFFSQIPETVGFQNDGKRLIPTLSYQLAKSIPSLRKYIEKEIELDPALFQGSLESQLQKLIHRPLLQMHKERPDIDLRSLPRLIIIDGLDACGGDSGDRVGQQKGALHVLRLLADHRSILPFHVVIFSRSNHQIRGYFENPIVKKLVRTFVLDERLRPQDDIFVFVNYGFKWIRDNHSHCKDLPQDWPGRRIVQMIVERSSGHFLYAAIAMQYIRSEEHNPVVRLQLLVDMDAPITSNITLEPPLVQLDAFYLQMTNAATDSTTARQIMAFQSVHPPNDFDVPLASLEDVLSLIPGTVRRALSDFAPLLVLLENPKQLIRYHHASFTEFIHHENRSKEWFVDVPNDAERFALLDLEGFENANTPEEQGFWFQCFCEALKKATPSSRLKDAITTTWMAFPSYTAGYRFFSNTGFKSHERFGELNGAICESRFSSDEREELVHDLLDAFTSALQPYVEPYRCNIMLHSILMFHACYGPYPFGSFSTNATKRHRFMLSYAYGQIASYEDADLLSVDENALGLINPPSLMDAKIATTSTSWLQQLLRHFCYFGLYLPPDDEILRDSTVRIISLFIMDGESLIDRINMINMIDWMLKMQTPSAEVIDCLEDHTMPVFIKAELGESPDVQDYLQRANAIGISTRNCPTKPELVFIPRISSSDLNDIAQWKPTPRPRYYALQENFKEDEERRKRTRLREKWDTFLESRKRRKLGPLPSSRVGNLYYYDQGLHEVPPDLQDIEVPGWGSDAKVGPKRVARGPKYLILRREENGLIDGKILIDFN